MAYLSLERVQSIVGAAGSRSRARLPEVVAVIVPAPATAAAPAAHVRTAPPSAPALAG